MNYQDAINSIRDVMSVVEEALKDECYDDIVAAKERLGDVDKALRVITSYMTGATQEVLSALCDLPWLPRDAEGHAASAQKHMMAALKWLDGDVDAGSAT